MFEPNEEEARRAEALSQATMSTVSTETIHGRKVHEAGTEMLVERAKQLENFLKKGEGLEFHDEDTLRKVYEVLGSFGLSEELRRDMISSLQNAGILFRERAKETPDA